MEQYQPIAQPEREPVSTTLQLAALILGIIGLITAIIYYFVSIFNSVILISDAVMKDGQSFEITASPNGTLMLVFGVIVFLVCLIAVVLGIAGLVRSIRRPRTVKGIVFSAVGLCTGIGGTAFTVISFFIKGFFTVITKMMPQTF